MNVIMDKMVYGVGERIQRLRKERKLTTEKFAEDCDISVRFLYDIERGQKPFSIEVLYRIAVALEVSCDYLIFGQD